MTIGRPTVSRRAFLAGAALLAASGPARSSTLQRPIAIMDWALLETALALGIVPKAAVELVLYGRQAVEPPVPTDVVDLGLRGAPNFELLARLAPKTIYGSNFTAWANGTFARIAPVRTFSIYRPGTSPFRAGESVMRQMGHDLAIADRADAYVADVGKSLAGYARELAGLSRPVYIVSFGDAGHVRVFGGDSMFGDVLQRLGPANAWSSPTRYSATAPVEIDVLAAAPDAAIAVVGPLPSGVEATLSESRVWGALEPVRHGRVLHLGPVDPYGGLPAALRFARLFASAAAASNALW